MIKVVINKQYGGFSLSREAVELARKLSGDPNWGGATIAGDIYPDGKFVIYDYGFVHDIKRSDPILVAVVEQLGSERASGRHAKLKVETTSAPYRIQEYDGREWIETPDGVDWEMN